jgi:hypothetical protein
VLEQRVHSARLVVQSSQRQNRVLQHLGKVRKAGEMDGGKRWPKPRDASGLMRKFRVYHKGLGT